MITPSATGRRCRKEALEDHDRCETHLTRRFTNPRHLPKFYMSMLRPTLAAAVKQHIEQAAPADVMSLTEELALIRQGSTHAVEVYQKALEANAGHDVLVAAATIMSAALEDVSKMVEKMCRVEELKARVNASLTASMQSYLSLVLHAIHDTLGDDYRVKELEEKIRGMLEAPDTAKGTLITPADSAVASMDDTIPEA